MLYNLVAAKRDFATHSPKLGDIRPRNIFINQGGDIKISNQLSWPSEGTNDQKAFEGIATYLGIRLSYIFQLPKKYPKWITLLSKSKHKESPKYSQSDSP